MQLKISLELSIHKLGDTPRLYLNQVRLNIHENMKRYWRLRTAKSMQPLSPSHFHLKLRSPMLEKLNLTKTRAGINEPQ